MLIIRTLLGDASKEVLDALRGASRHLATIGVFDGEVPQYGDWDEGRVLATSGDLLLSPGRRPLVSFSLVIRCRMTISLMNLPGTHRSGPALPM
jgi:hypothetical protein